MDHATALKRFTKRWPLRRRLDGLNNTYLVRDSTEPTAVIHVRLYKTNIITFFGDGDFSVSCDGYFGSPTPDRFRTYLPGGCWTWSYSMPGTGRKGDKIAVLCTPVGALPWKDGMVIGPRFRRADLSRANHIHASKLRGMVGLYARGYVNRLVYHGLPAPEKAGDCDRCIEEYNGGRDAFRLNDDHYIKHMERGEMPPTLILRAAGWCSGDLVSAAHDLFAPRRCLWKPARTMRAELERTEAELMGWEQPKEDPRTKRAELRDTVERFLLQQVGFEIFDVPKDTKQGMYRGESRNERMGW